MQIKLQTVMDTIYDKHCSYIFDTADTENIIRTNHHDELKQYCSKCETQQDFLYLGLYAEHIGNNFDDMDKYYTMAIQMGSIVAAFYYGTFFNGTYYRKNRDEYKVKDKDKEYFEMAIMMNDKYKNDGHDMGHNYDIICSRAAYYLAVYYQENEKENGKENNGKIKEYFEMAIALDGNNSWAMYGLGEYYNDIEKNDSEMKKYYLMAIEKGNSILSMYKLAHYYQSVENDDEMIKYNTMIIKQDCSYLYDAYLKMDAISAMANYYRRVNNYEKACEYRTLLYNDRSNKNNTLLLDELYKSFIDTAIKELDSSIEITFLMSILLHNNTEIIKRIDYLTDKSEDIKCCLCLSDNHDEFINFNCLLPVYPDRRDHIMCIPCLKKLYANRSYGSYDISTQLPKCGHCGTCVDINAISLIKIIK